MKVRRIMAFAWWNMKRRKLRTGLTMLGIVIGVAAIIALSSLGHGLESAMRAKMQQGFEIDVLPIMAGGMLSGGSGQFLDSDLEKVRSIPGISAATLVIQKTGIVPFTPDGKSNSSACILLAVDLEEFLKIYPERMSFESGGLPEDKQGRVAILGNEVQHLSDGLTLGDPGDEFEIQSPLIKGGEMILTNSTFSLAGVLEPRGASDFINYDNAIFIPIKAAEEICGTTEADMMMARIDDPGKSDSIAAQITDAFKPRKIRVLVPTTFMEQVDSILSMLDRFHITISSVALLVAGVGIMNIMTVSVMERIRDIGIMKAIGTSDRTILLIFLTEASIIGVMAALAGVPIGLGIAHLLSGFLFNFTLVPQEELLTGVQPPPLSVSPEPTLPWVLGAIAVGIVVSIVFGWYPARKAAKLDPVEAIRYE